MTRKVSPEEGNAIKQATRLLLDMAGSLDEASNHCRVDKTRLSKYQCHQHGEFMPIDVVYQLQMKMSSDVLSRKICDLAEIYGGGCLPNVGALHFEAMDVVPAVGEMVRFIREAKSEQSEGGRNLTENEKRKYFQLREAVDRELHELDVAVQRDSTMFIAAE